MEPRFSVLIIDDDPSHLRIYGWIMAAAGYKAVPALVTVSGIEYPAGEIDLVVMDYRLSGEFSAVEVAQSVRRRYPQAPIILLSDIYGLPSDIAPHVHHFVRKGEPEKLVAALERFCPHAPAA